MYKRQGQPAGPVHCGDGGNQHAGVSDFLPYGKTVPRQVVGLFQQAVQSARPGMPAEFGAVRPDGGAAGPFCGLSLIHILQQMFSVPAQLVQMLPYIVTILVITFAVRHVKGPAGTGKLPEE